MLKVIFHSDSIGWYIGRLIGYDGVRLTSQNCGFCGPIVHPWVIVLLCICISFSAINTFNLDTMQSAFQKTDPSTNSVWVTAVTPYITPLPTHVTLL
jgi:hypothetical protein